MMSFYPRFFAPIILPVLVVFLWDGALCAQENEARQKVGSGLFFYVKECSEPPILQYRCSSGHFGGNLSDSDIDKIFIWKDGTVAWEVTPKDRSWDRWYQSKIPVEKVEAAIKEIAEDFARYPSKDRSLFGFVIFRIDASYSPHIEVHSSRHHESLGLDFLLWKFYKENRDVLRSDDNEAILKTIKSVGNFTPGKVDKDGKYTGLHPAWMFDYKGLVNYYEHQQSQDKKAEIRKTDFSDEEILRAVAFYVADAEHLLMMEKKILDLLPSREGLKRKELETVSHYFDVEREIKDGKSEFFYVPTPEKESNGKTKNILKPTTPKRSRRR